MKILTARVVELWQAWAEKGPQGPIEDDLASLEPEEEDVAAAWDLEISRHVEEIRSGSAAGVPAEEVFAELR